MIDLYTARTPNGWKVSILLEELGAPYEVHALRLRDNEQKEPWFLNINPNGRIPAIVDRDHGDLAVFESGAILMYLAEMHGRFLAARGSERWAAMQWLMFQMGGVGPMMGQAYWFLNYAEERIEPAIERYRNESRRLLGVLEGRLAEASYLAGEYSIADMATYPWIRAEDIGIPIEDFPHVAAWRDRVGERPAVQRGMEIPPKEENE